MKDAAAVRLPPPLLYVAAVATGVLLDAFAVPFDLGLALPWRIALASAAAAAALVLIVPAFRSFRRIGQDPKPWTATPELVTTGIYRFTRNPMYVALTLVLVSLAAALNNGWLLALVPVTLWIVYRTAIRHEEAYLAAKFGDAYADYKRAVRRWV
ncbi:MAG: methyltransferase family protein [Planctomycetota bacterium]|jgi:protein-S-isoprenylcysteine O-methyltransferase Ste14